MSEIELPMQMDELEKFFNEKLGESVSDIKKEQFKKGLNETPMKVLWLTVDREKFRYAVKAVSEIQVPHLSVTSGSDKGDIVELIYHFHVNYGYPKEETSINMKVQLPKDDLKIPTITDMVPGAITTEREKQEFLGVDVVDIPDSRRLWLDENYPEDKYPWRWDDKGMEEMSHYPHDENENTLEKTVKEKAAERKGGDSDE